MFVFQVVCLQLIVYICLQVMVTLHHSMKQLLIRHAYTLDIIVRLDVTPYLIVAQDEVFLESILAY